MTKTENFDDSFSDHDSGNDSGEPSSVNVVPINDSTVIGPNGPIGPNEKTVRRVTGMVRHTGLVAQGKALFLSQKF